MRCVVTKSNEEDNKYASNGCCENDNWDFSLLLELVAVWQTVLICHGITMTITKLTSKFDKMCPVVDYLSQARFRPLEVDFYSALK